MYDFDEIIERKNTNSLKWDLKDAKASMWVADMDFHVAHPISKVVQKIAKLDLYGYSMIPNGFYSSIQNWWLEKHGIGYEKESMIFCKGIVPGISAIIRRFTMPGEKVCIQTPAYHMFYHMIEDNGRVVAENELMSQDGMYTVDFDALEKTLSDPAVTLFILCNPHNPTGNVWDRNTLKRIGELCEQYGVLVVSDEIHCDIIQPGFSYVPYAKVDSTCFNNSIIFISATKAFNIAGLDSSCAIVPNTHLREKVKRQFNLEGLSHPNIFSCEASMAAFNESEDWLIQMNQYVWDNKETACEFISSSIPELKVSLGQATYMIWVDCSKITDNTDDLCDLLLEKYGLFVSKGSEFGDSGKAFIRVNLACTSQKMLEGLLLLREGVRLYKIRKQL